MNSSSVLFHPAYYFTQHLVLHRNLFTQHLFWPIFLFYPVSNFTQHLILPFYPSFTFLSIIYLFVHHFNLPGILFYPASYFTQLLILSIILFYLVFYSFSILPSILYMIVRVCECVCVCVCVCACFDRNLKDTVKCNATGFNTRVAHLYNGIIR